MTTASEVGGDYYDFHEDAAGTLTVALGDATGHGLQAGIVVTAVKSLFLALAPLPDISRIFTTMSGNLKAMRMRRANMAMTILKYHDGRLWVAAAGMPPVLLYRAATGSIEEIEQEGMPLGSSARFQYDAQESFILESGDTMVLMSDGLPERQNGNQEQLGYPRTRELFAVVAEKQPEEICSHLERGGEEWGEGVPQDDDVTFVVLKVR